MSQSLCSRDKFLIAYQQRYAAFIEVAIPLQQGQVFNGFHERLYEIVRVAIPLQQGQVFNAVQSCGSACTKSRNPFAAGTSF